MLYLKQLLRTIPAPIDNSDEPLQFQVALLDYNDYVGRIGIGRVFRGTMNVGQQFRYEIRWIKATIRVTKLFGFFGLKREEIQSAKAGDINCYFWYGRYQRRGNSLSNRSSRSVTTITY